MKTTILTLLLIIPTLVRCQINSNIITQQEFNNITINNVTFSNIKATNGDQNLLDNLFTSNIIESNIDPDGDFYNYKFNGFAIGFSSIMGTIETPVISSFEITNNNWSINIQGHTVSIGSHKDDLGNVLLNNPVNGVKSIIYQYCDGCNNFLSFDLDENNIIIRIIYIEMT